MEPSLRWRLLAGISKILDMWLMFTKATCRGVGLSSPWRSSWWGFLYMELSGRFFPHNFLREQLNEVATRDTRNTPVALWQSSTVRLASWQEIVNIDRHKDSLYKCNTKFACLFGLQIPSALIYPRSWTGPLEPMRCIVVRDDAPAFRIVAPEQRRAVIRFPSSWEGCAWRVELFRALGCKYGGPKFSNHLLSKFFRLGKLSVCYRCPVAAWIP